jgi:hypothetical protein
MRKIFRKQVLILWIGVLLLVLAACSPADNTLPETGEGGTPPVGTPGLAPAAVLAAQTWLSEQLGVEIDQVAILEMEQTEWSDSCLGLGQANESCAQVMVPGWRVVLQVNQDTYEVRTDDLGDVIRMVTPQQ